MTGVYPALIEESRTPSLIWCSNSPIMRRAWYGFSKLRSVSVVFKLEFNEKT